jgi:hypothetical protein
MRCEMANAITHPFIADRVTGFARLSLTPTLTSALHAPQPQPYRGISLSLMPLVKPALQFSRSGGYEPVGALSFWGPRIFSGGYEPSLALSF